MEYSIETMVLFGLAVLAAGVVAGLIAGMLGVGGGIVVVPVLFYLFTLMDVNPEVRMHMAVGTSLSTIIVTAISSTRAHYRKQSIDTALLRSWGPWLLAGAVIGMLAFGSLDTTWLTVIFASVALMVSIYMVLAPEPKGDSDQNFPKGVVRYALGLVVGGISSVMGIGGGTLSVPVLSLFRYPIRRAVGTAAAIGLLISVPGTIGAFVSGLGVENRPPLSLGYVNLLAFCVLVPVTAMVAPYGARLAHSISPRALRYAFAAFLLFNATNMFLSI